MSSLILTFYGSVTNSGSEVPALYGTWFFTTLAELNTCLGFPSAKGGIISQAPWSSLYLAHVVGGQGPGLFNEMDLALPASIGMRKGGSVAEDHLGTLPPPGA